MGTRSRAPIRSPRIPPARTSSLYGAAAGSDFDRTPFFIIQGNAMQSDHAIPQAPLRIVLIGFMGAGKSTAGPILAERLGWRFIDADIYLQNRKGSTIADLFSNHGETAFRRMEAEVFSELHGERDLVLALGGGAIESESTRFLLRQSNDTCVVFLNAPLEILIDRCEKQIGAAIRPVLRQRDALSQ